MSNLGNMNQLPADVKILIVNAHDCKAIEKIIKKFSAGKANEKDIEALKLAVVRLQTTAGALVGVK